MPRHSWEKKASLASTSRSTVAWAGGSSRSLVSKSVDLLLKRGYLQASPDARDRRVARLRLMSRAVS